MKRLLLGMSLLLSTQMVQAFAEDNNQIELEAISAENTLSLYTASNMLSSLSVGHAKKLKEKDILPPVGKTLFSSSNIDMFPDGTTDTTTSLSLTVLNSTDGVARIKIEVFEGTEVLTNIFVTGRSGDKYYGNSIVFIGSSDILISRVKGHLEVVQTFLDEEIPNGVSVSRSIFPLHNHSSK